MRLEPGAQADPEADRIAVDGRPLPRPAALRYALLHKPPGYVSSRSDPEGRRVVVDLLPAEMGRLYPVGRLDYDAEGLLLLVIATRQTPAPTDASAGPDAPDRRPPVSGT